MSTCWRETPVRAAALTGCLGGDARSAAMRAAVDDVVFGGSRVDVAGAGFVREDADDDLAASLICSLRSPTRSSEECRLLRAAGACSHAGW